MKWFKILAPGTANTWQTHCSYCQYGSVLMTFLNGQHKAISFTFIYSEQIRTDDSSLTWFYFHFHWRKRGKGIFIHFRSQIFTLNVKSQPFTFMENFFLSKPLLHYHPSLTSRTNIIFPSLKAKRVGIYKVFRHSAFTMFILQFIIVKNFIAM